MKSKNVILAVLAAAACAAAFSGLGWDAPSDARAARLLSPAWDRATLFERLSSGWQDIYKKSEGSTPLAAEAAGKYTTNLSGEFQTDFASPLPPPELDNSYRSMLIRSRYPDEALPLSDLARMKPAELNFRPPSFLYGGGYIYPLGAYYLGLSVTGAIKRLSLRSVMENPDALGRIYLAGRLVSALSLLGICVLALLIARRLAPGCPEAAAFAAVLAMPSVVIYSHYLTPHLWAACWGLASIYFALCALPRLNLKPLLLSAACLGLSAGSYWSALHTAFFVLAIMISPGWSGLDRGAIKRILLAAVAAAAVFFILNPYLPFNWAAAVYEVFPGGSSPWGFSNSGLYPFFLKTLPQTIGPSLAILFPVGCLWGIFSGDRVLRNLSAAVLIFALPAAKAIPPDFPSGVRRFFPWLVTGAVIGAVFLGWVASRLPKRVRAAAVALVLAPGLLMSLAYALTFVDAAGPRSTFYRMADKLDSMTAGHTLGMLNFPQPAYMPAFRLDRWKLRLADSGTLQTEKRDKLPEYLLINFDQKPRVSVFLRNSYELYEAYYPRKILGFSPDPFLSSANPPMELFRLKPAGSK